MKKFELKNWEINGYYPYVPQMNFEQAPGTEDPRRDKGITDWIPATVPGCVQQDLWRAGWIEDPYFGQNSLRCEWVENKWWAYRTYFDVKREADRRYHLRMNGLDYKCHIYLNNQYLMVHEGSFDPVDLDVTKQLKDTSNCLIILFESSPDEDSQCGKTSHTRTQKSRFSYKWDFSTRMVPVGIWDDIWLEETGDGTIDRVWLIPEIKGARGKLTLRAVCGFWEQAQITQYDLRMRVFQNGNCLSDQTESFTAQSGIGRADLQTWIDNPQKWYPNGLGQQPLYEVYITLLVNGVESSAWTGRIGFKELHWIQNEQAPEGALPYCLQVNGQRVYLKGVNLTPFDMLIGTVTQEKYRLFLEQIRAANINFVRVNGVGLIEKECFYNLCDELGILVWQEFIQTSSSMERMLPTLPSYMDRLARTSRAAIEIKRNHVSLACYCGGNELNDSPGKAASYENPNIAFLRDLVNTYDTGRMYFPTSSTGPTELLEWNRQGLSHDVHGPWVFQPDTHYALYNQSDSLLHTELGAEGMAHIDSLKRFLAPQDLVVTDMDQNRTWRHHGEWWDSLERDTKLFGEIPDLEAFVYASQLMQAEAMRYALESNRRRTYHNSGSMVWAYNEPFPNVSNTCLVDYYGVPKMSYYAVQDAYRTLHMSMCYDKLIYEKGENFTGDLFLHNSLEQKVVNWKVQVFSLDGVVLEELQGKQEIFANGVTKVGTLTFPITEAFGEVFLIRLRFQDENQEKILLNEYLFSTCQQEPFGTLLKKKEQVISFREKPELQKRENGEEAHVYEVTNQGRQIAMHVAPVIEGENEFLYAEYSYKCLLPGETRLYHVSSKMPGKHWDQCRFVCKY